MTSPPPLQYGSYYHIFNRGNNRENLFYEGQNYRYFMKLYARYIELVADTYAYCLLRNHFHILVRIKSEDEIKLSHGDTHTFKDLNPSQQFSSLFNAYAKAINKTYHRTGSLFINPFGRIQITSDSHFIYLIAYIHLNPQKHGFVKDFYTWPYSSYQAFYKGKITRLKSDDVMAWFGGRSQFEEFHHANVDFAVIRDEVMDDP